MVLERYFMNYIHEFDMLDRAEWNYEDGCVLIGLQALYEATGEECYLDSIRAYIDRYVGQDGSIKGYEPEEFNLDRIPSGRVLFLLYEKTGIETYRKAIENLMQQIRKQPRTDSGSFWHKQIYHDQIWLDGLYMGLPFYTLYENQFDAAKNYKDIINQFRNVREFLYDARTGLYYHGFDEKKEMFWANKFTGLSANIWSRALGWYVMAIADCFELMPEKEKESRAYLASLLKEVMDGILKYQHRESGLFYQLTVLPKQAGNYLETSASAMFSYALLKGYRTCALKEEYYREKGEEILAAIESRQLIQEHGQIKLTGMCKGAGLGPEDNPRRDGSIAYYLDEAVVSDEQKGTGAAMMAYSEWLKLKNGGRLAPSEHPKVVIYNQGYELLRW